jgi:HlyD family secretion protein
VFRSRTRYVKAIDAESRIHELKVETGRRRGADIELLGRIAPDTRLALAGGAFLTDGDLVSVKGAAPAPATADATTPAVGK